MELDKRVGDYAAAIVRDVDLLLSDLGAFNDRQQKCIVQAKENTMLFLSLYNPHVNDFAELTIKSYGFAVYIHEVLRSIRGNYGMLMMTELIGPLAEKDAQRIQQILWNTDLISNTFASWEGDKEKLLRDGIQLVQDDLQVLWTGEAAITDERTRQYLQPTLEYSVNSSQYLQTYFASRLFTRPLTRSDYFTGIDALHNLRIAVAHITVKCHILQQHPEAFPMTEIQHTCLQQIATNSNAIQDLLLDLLGATQFPSGISESSPSGSSPVPTIV